MICPECKENILINIYDFKVNFYGCKNYHAFNDLPINNFYETQKIDKNDIECNECQETIKNYFICNICDKNLCLSCKSIHDKSHIIISYVCRRLEK